MIKDGYRVWKGKNNHEPCHAIYKGLYMVKPAWYVKNHLVWYQADIKSIVEAFRLSIDNNNEFAKSRWEALSMTKENKQKTKTEEEKAEVEKRLHDGNTCFHLQNIQNNSMAISIFSYLEGYLWNICRELEFSLDSKIKLKHISKNDYLNNFYSYLINVADLNSETIKHCFDRIEKKKFIRNRIIHNSNTIIDSTEAKKLKEIDGIKFHEGKYDDHFFYVETEFLMSLLEDIEELFETLFHEISERIFAPIQITRTEKGILIEPQYPSKRKS